MSLRTVVAVVVFVALPVAAQAILQQSTTAGTGYNARNLVRDGSGRLWTLSMVDVAGGDRPLVLQSSLDGGATWTSSTVVFNDAASGLNGTNLVNVCALCVDGTGKLHATWGRYYYPSYYQQYYRNYDPTTNVVSPTLVVGSVTGAAVTSRTAALDVIADASDTIWLVAHGATSWVEKLLKSTAPSAAGNTFTDVGAISPSGSAQNTRITVDAAGQIHAAFYRGVGSGNIEHRVYNPASGWATTTTILGNTTPTNDYYGMLAADDLGYVHAIVVVDAAAGSTWGFNYLRRDPNGVWSPSTPLFSATSAQYTNIANYFIFSIAADETTGKCSTVYRDLSAGGPLRLAEKNLGDATFTPVLDLRPATTASHAYYLPAIRGTLYPVSNRTGGMIDVTWRDGAAPGPYAYMFQRIGAAGGANVALATPATVGSLATFNCSSPSDANLPFVVGFAAGTQPGIPLADARVIPLNYDFLLQLSLSPGNGVFVGNVGTLDSAGLAQGFIAIPAVPSLAGIVFHAALVVVDASNPTGVGNISPPLTITVL